MNNQEAIKELQEAYDTMRSYDIESSESRLMTALAMAIKALEQEPTEEGGYCCRTCEHKRINKDGIWCENPTCQWEQAETNISKQEPSGDLISRQTVLDGIEELKKSPWATDKRGNGFEYLIAEALDVVADLCVKQAPSVKQEPKGHWTTIEMTQDDGCRYTVTYCSECDEDVDYRTDYCPNCGARMVKPQEERDKEC